MANTGLKSYPLVTTSSQVLGLQVCDIIPSYIQYVVLDHIIWEIGRNKMLKTYARPNQKFWEWGPNNLVQVASRWFWLFIIVNKLFFLNKSFYAIHVAILIIYSGKSLLYVCVILSQTGTSNGSHQLWTREFHLLYGSQLVLTPVTCRCSWNPLIKQYISPKKKKKKKTKTSSYSVSNTLFWPLQAYAGKTPYTLNFFLSVY